MRLSFGFYCPGIAEPGYRLQRVPVDCNIKIYIFSLSLSLLFSSLPILYVHSKKEYSLPCLFCARQLIGFIAPPVALGIFHFSFPPNYFHRFTKRKKTYNIYKRSSSCFFPSLLREKMDKRQERSKYRAAEKEILERKIYFHAG